MNKTPKVRIGNDIDVTWNVNLTAPDGSRVDLRDLSLTVTLLIGTKELAINYDNAGLTIGSNTIAFTFFGARQQYTGSYIVKLTDAVNTSITYDTRNVFIIVDHSWESLDVISEPTSVTTVSTIEVSKVVKGAKGDKGDKGDPGEKGDAGNNIRLDLDNEHEDFLYNDSGYNVSGTVTSRATLRDGTEPIVASNINWSISEYVGTNANYAFIASTGVLSVTHILATKAKVTVRAEYPKNSGVYYYASFTANRTNQDKYDLVFSDNSVIYNGSSYTTKDVSIHATRLDLSGAKSNVTFGDYTIPVNISTTEGKGYLRLFYQLVSGNTFADPVQQITGTFSLTSVIASANDAVYFELRKYADCEDPDSGNYSIADYDTLPIGHVADGTSPWIADLDNEMDSVACDSGAHPVAAQSVSTNICLFFGNIARAFTTTVTGYTSGTAVSGITVTWDNVSTAATTDTVTVAFDTTAVISDGKKDFEIVLTPEDDISSPRTLHFTVNGIKGGAIYSLVPSASAVSKSDLGVFSPNSISCEYTKFEIAKSAFVTPAGGTIKYTKDGGSTEYTYSSALTPGTDFTANVTFLLYVGGNLVDRESVPIVSDGVSGSSTGIVLDLDNEVDAMLYTQGGTLVSGNVVATATLHDGTTDVTSSVTSWAISATGCTATNNDNVITVTGMTAAQGTVVITAVYNGSSYRQQLSLKKLVGIDKYELVVNPSSISYNTTTEVASATELTVQCFKTDVTGVRALSLPPAGGYIVVYADSTRLGYVNDANSLTIQNLDVSDVDEIICYIGDSNDISLVAQKYDWETVPVLKAANGSAGAQGAAGKSIRVTAWQTGKIYYSGDPTELVDGICYLDIVSDKESAILGATDVHYYMCKDSHTSSNISELSDTDLWTPLANTSPLVTPFILTDKIKAGMIDVDSLVADDAFIGNLKANRVSTGDNSIGTNIQEGVFEIKKDGIVRARFGVSGGDLVLQFLSANGNVLYEFGPNGILNYIDTRDPYFEQIQLAAVASDVSVIPDHSDGPTWSYPSTFTPYYIFHDGVKRSDGVVTYYVSNPNENLTEHSEFEGKVFVGESRSYNVISDGLYIQHAYATTSPTILETTNKKIVFDRASGPINPPDPDTHITGYWFFVNKVLSYNSGKLQSEGTSFVFRRPPTSRSEEISMGANEPIGLNVLTRVHDITNIENEAQDYRQ